MDKFTVRHVEVHRTKPHGFRKGNFHATTLTINSLHRKCNTFSRAIREGRGGNINIPSYVRGAEH